mmetsp:Transcript_26635/g.26523  ORF Transcript_26635/g.26523 Transcript_26635/m.26523 type:complete len:112 (+) Transcript_26635:138-473(+)
MSSLNTNKEITLVTDSLYFYLTTGSGIMTLGEEYCQIVPKQSERYYNPSFSKRVQIRKRVKALFYVTSVFAPYLSRKIFEPLYRRWLQKWLNESVSPTSSSSPESTGDLKK